MSKASVASRNSRPRVSQENLSVKSKLSRVSENKSETDHKSKASSKAPSARAANEVASEKYNYNFDEQKGADDAQEDGSVQL